VPGDVLNDGVHRVGLQFVRHGAKMAWHADDLLIFELREAAELVNEWRGKRPGFVRPPLAWTRETPEIDGPEPRT
jgi:hypothetical protein